MSTPFVPALSYPLTPFVPALTLLLSDVVLIVVLPTALVRPNNCGRKGDIGDGSLSTVSRSSMVRHNFSVRVMVGLSLVVGKKSALC